MTLASRAREAARANPFVYEGLRAGVINYSAAARVLDVGDEEAVAASLRRYGEELSERDRPDRSVRVTMESGVGLGEEGELLVVGDRAIERDGGELTAVLATGDVDARLLASVLGCFDAEGIDVESAGVTDASLAVVVQRRDGPQAVRRIEQLA